MLPRSSRDHFYQSGWKGCCLIVGCVYNYIPHPNTKLVLPLTGKWPKQQQRRQAPQRQHAFYTYQVPGASSSAPTSLGRKRLFFCTTRTVSVDTIYDLRLAQPNKKKGKNEAREACRFVSLYNIGFGVALGAEHNLSVQFSQRPPTNGP